MIDPDMHAPLQCSHGPVVHAGVDDATHTPCSQGNGINLSCIRRLPPHGPPAHGYNASRRAAVAFYILLLLLTPLAHAAPATANLVPALGWDLKKQGGFPTSIAVDASENVWVGTEGNGLWNYDAAKKQWTQFTAKDGLGDDCVYALAVDKLNRVWAGHLNHGVSVYNGDKWRNYGLVDGPIGDRVFAIAISPKDSDVWIATDLGIARYSEKRQDWDYYTRASGLPSDQIQSIAFDSKGQVYARTQCTGVAIAGPDDNYTKWRSLRRERSHQQTPVRLQKFRSRGALFRGAWRIGSAGQCR